MYLKGYPANAQNPEVNNVIIKRPCGWRGRAAQMERRWTSLSALDRFRALRQ